MEGHPRATRANKVFNQSSRGPFQKIKNEPKQLIYLGFYFLPNAKPISFLCFNVP